MLSQITPVLLTNTEAVNIGRTLSKLSWANDIVLVDSGSLDDTLEIAARFPNVRIFHHPLETHAAQWRYAVESTGIQTPWILRLDADYQVTDELVNEISKLDPNDSVSAYRISFDYAVFGHKLVASVYPPNTVFLRRGTFSIRAEGHTERWNVTGLVKPLKSRIVHDDWKSTERWLANQVDYSKRDFLRLSSEPRATLSGRIRDHLRRRPPIMPIASFLYCLFGKGLVLNGRWGVYYALQRLVAEATLALRVLEQQILSEKKACDE